jgi:putative alpha-1,2-mannosidase
LNGESFDRTYLSHQEITAGGELTFEMVSAPDYKWAVEKASRPPRVMPKPE